MLQSNMADDTILVRVVDEMMNVIDFVGVLVWEWVAKYAITLA